MGKIICIIESLAQGGAERQLIGLSNKLAECGNHVEIWTYYKDEFYLGLLNKAVKYRYLDKAASKVKRIPTFYKELKQADPDTVIAYLSTSTIIACVCKLLGLRYKLIVSERNTTKIITFKDRIRFNLFRLADFVVPNSHTQEDVLNTHFPFLKSKVRCITNFVEMDRFKALERNIDVVSGNRILVVARIAPQKNTLNFIKALSVLQKRGVDFSCEWYGLPTDKVYFDECKRLVDETGLSGHFSFHSPVSNISDVYSKASVLCLPSIHEGFPNVVCEAMASGLPIICSNISENKYIVKDGENGWLHSPENIEDIADKLESFTKVGTDERIRMGVSNRSLIDEMCSFGSFIKKYKEIIR